MVERIGHVRNPLTIIAVFAGIAEVSGTIVLPFIAPSNQSTFVWFLIAFPTLLVLLFFATLNFNHKLLYAPSEFVDEENFFRKASPAEKEAKRRGEFPAPDAAPAERQPAPSIAGPVDSARDDGAPISNYDSYVAAENAVFDGLAQELGMPIRRDIRFDTYNDMQYVFDGIVERRESITAIEFEYYPFGVFVPSLATRAQQVEAVWERMPDSMRHRFSLILAIAVDRDSFFDVHLLGRIYRTIGPMPFLVSVRLFNVDELGGQARSPG